MLAQTALEAFTQINRKTLEQALSYLACPLDKQELFLDIESRDAVSDGQYICSRCKTIYPIINGVPYFFATGNGFEWDATSTLPEIKQRLAETQDIQVLWKMILSLAPFLLTQTKDRKLSIDTLFEIVTSSPRDPATQAILMQAATAARYDLENYRGTFTLDNEIICSLQQRYAQGIIVEGACATGENLLALTSLDSDFYIGLDISGVMVRTAQQQAKKNMLFLQGDICSLPLRQRIAEVYVLNNVFDRVVDPPQACTEASNVISAQGYFVLSNCDPLQFTYTTQDNRTVLFVPREKQLSLEQGLAYAGFTKIREQQGVWQIQTVAYGAEQLPYKTIYGGRKNDSSTNK